MQWHTPRAAACNLRRQPSHRHAPTTCPLPSRCAVALAARPLRPLRLAGNVSRPAAQNTLPQPSQSMWEMTKQFVLGV